ncbi:hypothetical protein CAPTEDRAFT_180472 [Capitella teleta]|uniref:Transporter n=1 Tax=Capitella teleta TaxID=283909 RepID=R7TYZ7_CAPTE|nr:hypothetical protein CAPTEDRAFT_180472 [Capitella teleta]|eukprot:ELT98822.1 hypothetical protein CAPTEDRAFT_180472 [Capitella teleta]
MLVLIGIPMFFIEISAGQFTGHGPMYAYEASPIFQGVGVGMVIMTFISNIYYNMIIGWSLYYMFASWQKVLPWYDCSNDFNTDKCYSKRQAEGFAEWLDEMVSKRESPSEEYFDLVVLDRSDTLTDSGYVKWDITLCFLLAWVMCFFCVIKGIKSSGKVVYFTATFPYLILIILLVKGLLLDGAKQGIDFYIIPDWSKLKTPKVWVDAAGQIFFSLSVGLGGLMSFASYNKFKNNVYRDTLIVSIGNCMTSFVSGFTIFAIIGHLAKVLGRDVDKVAKSGSGLAFVVYPEVVTYLDPPQLWATLFFFMLIMLGLDSQFAGIENCMTAMVDVFPKLRPYKTWVAFFNCFVSFFLGLTMCTQAGAYWLDLMGYYSSGLSLVIIGLCEVIVFAWVYGARNIKADIELMCGFQIEWHWWFCWSFVSPAVMIVILIFNCIDFTPLSYGDYVLPDWSQGLGWCMALVSMLAIPICAVLKFIASFSNPAFDGLGTLERLRKLTQPSPMWTARKNRETGSTDDDVSPPAAIQAYSNPAFEKPAPDTCDTVL